MLAALVAALSAAFPGPARAAEFRLLSWEIVETTCPAGLSYAWKDCQFTEQLKVPGGWLVRSTRLVRDLSGHMVPPGLPRAGNTYETGGGLGTGVGLTFLPDPNYAWNPKQ